MKVFRVIVCLTGIGVLTMCKTETTEYVVIVSGSDKGNFYEKQVYFPCEMNCVYKPNILFRKIIKPERYKDGKYTFYSDSSMQDTLFRGYIRDGKTTGFYYQASYDWGGLRDGDGGMELPDGIAVPVKVTSGNLDSTFLPTKENSIGLRFHKGTIEKISFRNDRLYERTIAFYFDAGKLDSAIISIHDVRFPGSQPILNQKEMLLASSSVSGDTKKHSAQVVYPGLDSAKIYYERSMADVTGYLYYDSLLHLRKIFISPGIIDLQSGEISLIFGTDGQIKNIVFPYLCSRGEYWTNCDFIGLSFSKDGKARIE